MCTLVWLLGSDLGVNIQSQAEVSDCYSKRVQSDSLIATVQAAEAPPQNSFSQHVFTGRRGEGGQNPLPSLAQLKILVLLPLSPLLNSLLRVLYLSTSIHCGDDQRMS